MCVVADGINIPNTHLSFISYVAPEAKDQCHELLFVLVYIKQGDEYWIKQLYVVVFLFNKSIWLFVAFWFVPTIVVLFFALCRMLLVTKTHHQQDKDEIDKASVGAVSKVGVGVVSLWSSAVRMVQGYRAFLFVRAVPV